MINPAGQEASTITVNPTFWELFMAALLMIPYQGKMIVVHAIFPLAGISCLFLPSLLGQPFRVSLIIPVLLGLLFTPIVLASGLYTARKSKLAQGPFTYRFDDEGIHIAGASSSQTIKWSGIVKVRKTTRFLYIFVGPAMAHAISMKALKEQGVFDKVSALMQRHSNNQ